MRKITILTLKTAAAILTVLVLLGANCITSGNVLIVIDDLGEIDVDDSVPPPGDWDNEEVDLTTYSDWTDHKDDLLSVDDVGFALRVENHLGTEISGQMYISDKNYSSKSAFNAAKSSGSAHKILDGITVAPNATRSVEWKESYDYIENFDKLKEIVLNPDEIFYIYFVTTEDDFDFRVYDIVLFLSVNGKP